MKLEGFVFDFLDELSKNNNREWFKQNEDTYKRVIAHVRQFVTILIEGIAAFDASVATQTYKTCIFRIYKDVRFSKDKTPYKTHIGTFVAPDGYHGIKAGYYLHLESGNVLLSGGMWCPPNDLLKKVRTEIYYAPEDLLKIIENKTFKSTFGSFVEEGKLTRPPKGYAADFEHIELLKNKHFCVEKRISNAEALDDDFMDLCLKTFKVLHPLNAYLNMIIDLED